jgi:hypothetical protein
MLIEIPPAISDDRFDEIIGKVQSDSATTMDRDEVILGNLWLAEKVTRRMRRKFKRENQDILEEGFTQLTEAMDDIFHRKYLVNDRLHAIKYVVSTITHRCKDYVEEVIRSVSMPGRTLRHKMEHGINRANRLTDYISNDGRISDEAKELLIKLPLDYQDIYAEDARTKGILDFKREIQTVLYDLIPIPKVMEIREDGNWADEGDDARPLKNKFYRSLGDDPALKGTAYTIPIAPPTNIGPEITEAIRKSLHAPIEELVVNLRAKGMTYKEVGDELGISAVMVCKHMAKITERFEQIYDS